MTWLNILHIMQCIQDHDLDFLAISETGRRDFLVNFLNRLSGGLDFTCYSRPPHGRSGGMLLSVKSESLDVLVVTGVIFI